MSSSKQHDIVILGGSFAGLSIAHYLLRHTIPALTSNAAAYKVTIINPSTHVLYKIATPRVLINPQMISTDKVLLPIAPGFQEYDPSRIEIIQAEATSVNPSSKNVDFKYTDGTERMSSISYGSLVIATGTVTASPLWTLHGTHDATKKAIEDVHSRLDTAQSILVAGGGPAGIETTGELANKYGTKKSITLLSGTSRLLARLDTKSMGRDAEAKLKSFGVKTIHNLKVSSATQQGNGKTLIKFGDGTERTVDLYIDATGDRPVTGFLPKEWLNNGGFVLVDEPTLRVTGAADVYAIGSVQSSSNGGVLDINKTIKPAAESIKFDRMGMKSEQQPEEAGWMAWLTSWFFTSTEPGKRTQNYKPFTKDMQLVPLGKDGGVGVLMGWRAPTFMVKMIKSKNPGGFFIDNAPGLVKGSDYVKA